MKHNEKEGQQQSKVGLTCSLPGSWRELVSRIGLPPRSKKMKRR